MTLERYVEGLVYIALAFVPIGMASHAWRARLLPGWRGATGRLAEIVIGLSVVIVVSEVLGATYLFRTAAIVPTLAVVGLVGWWVGRRVTGRSDSQIDGAGEGDQGTLSSSASVVALIATSILVAEWSTQTIDAFHHGMLTTDTLWYHMPLAARFVQQGTITPLHYADSGSVTVFFPATSELFHGLGILLMGNDVLSPLINIGWMAVALLAAWCVGKPYGVAPVTLTGSVVLLATPGLVATQPGGAYDDVVGLALLLSCAALLATCFSMGGTARSAAQGIAALAAGLALGTKLNFIAPVGAMTVGVVVLARRGRRLREGVAWLLLLALTGGFWYARNLIVVGNPLPSLNLKLGPFALPSPATHTPSSIVAQFLLQGHSWREYFLPGLRLSFGPAWWALLALAGAGLVLCTLSGPSQVARMLGWVGLASAAAFVVTPQYLAVLGVPLYFVYNVRYVDPAIVLGLVLLPVIPRMRPARRLWSLLLVYCAILGVTQLDGTIWPITIFSQRFAPPIRGAEAVGGLLLGIVTFGIGLVLINSRRHPRAEGIRHHAVYLPIAAVALLILGMGFSLQQYYLRHRYTGANVPFFYSWAQGVSDARIGVAGGYMQFQYELYGRDLTNFVQYVAQPEPNYGNAAIASCDQWRRLVDAGDYDYVLTSTGLVSHRDEVFTTPFSYTVWTADDPASSLVRREILALPSSSGGSTKFIGVSLFRLHGRLDPARCVSPSQQKSVPTPS